MHDNPLIFECVGPVAWFTLNRPDSMNAISMAMIKCFEEALLEVERNPEIKVLAITGAGRAFCAGVDLKETLYAKALPPGEPDLMDRLGGVFDQLRALPKPVVAALNGITMAGGLEIAMCADIVVAAETTRIGDGHANYGVYPGGGGGSTIAKNHTPEHC